MTRGDGTGAANAFIKTVLLAAFLLYSVVWSIVVLLRYYSYNAGVFDLGLASSYLYTLSHSGISYLTTIPTHLPLNKMIVVVLAAPYAAFPDPRWLIVFQSIWIGAGIFPLYRISKRYIPNEIAPVLLSISYLLYYPLAGVNWFDFHFMSIFPTAFLFSVMFNIEGKKGKAIFFGLIAVMSDYLVPLIFIFYILYCVLKRWHDEGKFTVDSYNISMIGISALVLILVNVAFGLQFTTQYMHLSGATYSTAYVASVNQKLVYFYAMLLPVLFLSILGLDFLAVGIPFFALAFVNTYEPYVTTMYFQYPALIAPIIFISAAVGMKRLIQLIPKRKKAIARSVTVAVLVVNILLFSFFTPIGNMYTGNIYNGTYGKYISGNSFQYTGIHDTTVTAYDRYLSEISAQVPAGSSILIQNNMPGMTAGYNWELPDFRQSGFVPQYVLIDPYSTFYYQFSAAYHPDNTTMVTMANSYAHSGKYSIEYSMDGIVLLNRTSSKQLAGFAPLYLNTTMPIQSGKPYFNSGYNRTYYQGSLPFIISGFYLVNLTAQNSSINLANASSLYFVNLESDSLIPFVPFHLTGGEFGIEVQNFSGPLIATFLPQGNLTGQSLQFSLVQFNPDHVTILP